MKKRFFRFTTLLVVFTLLMTSLLACKPSAPDPTPTPGDSGQPSGSPQASQTPEASPTPTPTPTQQVTPIPTPEPTPSPAPTELKLKFGSYNIGNGEYVKHDFSVLANDIKDKDLDIVGLQEVDVRVPRSGNKNSIRLLSEASGLRYYAFFKAINIGPFGEYGVAVLSKYPIVSTDSTLLPSATYEQRVLGHAVIDVDGTQINFFVSHLSYENDEVRKEQFAKINEVVNQYDDFVLTADFNTTQFQEYTAIQGSDMVNNAKRFLVTFPSSKSSIDNIVFSKSCWTFGKAETLTLNHSDHYMLFAEGTFQIPSEKQK